MLYSELSIGCYKFEFGNTNFANQDYIYPRIERFTSALLVEGTNELCKLHQGSHKTVTKSSKSVIAGTSMVLVIQSRGVTRGGGGHGGPCPPPPLAKVAPLCQVTSWHQCTRQNNIYR